MLKKIASTKRALVLLLSIAAGTVQASQIALSNNVLIFKNNENIKQNIDILHVDKKTDTYVKTVVREILSPQKSAKEGLSEPLSPKESGLFVTPNKQVLPKGVESRELSIVNVNQNLKKERIYRVDVIPVINGVETQKNQMAIKILVAYDVLVYVQPQKLEVKYNYEFNNNYFTLENTGNVHFTVSNLLQCIDDICDDMNKQGQLFPDHNARLNVGEATRIMFDLSVDGQPTEQIVVDRKM